MPKMTSRLRLKKGWLWTVVTLPLASILLLQVYLWVPSRPYVWGAVKSAELACVEKGPATPFGQVFFLGAIPHLDAGRDHEKVRKVGLFFLGAGFYLTGDGFGFEPNGVLYMRLNKRKIWTVDPWLKTVQLISRVEVQDPMCGDDFSSNQFCVAGDVVWFETWDKDGADALFAQEADKVVEVFSRGDIFDILSCSTTSACISWDGKEATEVTLVSRNGGQSLSLMQCNRLECFFDRGDFRPGRAVFLKENRKQSWFYQLTEGSENAVIEVGNRYCAIFGSNNNLFFLTYDDSRSADVKATLIEEMDVQQKRFVTRFWVDGCIKRIAERDPLLNDNHNQPVIPVPDK